MAVRGYVLIEAEVGKAKAVGEAIRSVKHSDARVIAVEKPIVQRIHVELYRSRTRR